MATVVGEGGWTGTLEEEPVAGGLCAVRLGSGRRLFLPAEALEPQAGGNFRVAIGGDELERLQSVAQATDGRSVDQTLILPTGQNGSSREIEAVIPIVAETLSVSKKVVDTGTVRVTKTVSERSETVDVPLAREEVTVERVPVDRLLEAGEKTPVQRHEGNTLVVPLMEEVLVVETRLFLKEELRITKNRREVHEPQTVTLRREEARIERVAATEAPQKTGAEGTNT